MCSSDLKSDESGKCNPFYQEEFATYFGSTQINVALNVTATRESLCVAAKTQCNQKERNKFLKKKNQGLIS